MAAVGYRGVVEQVGPLDFRSSEHVTGELIRESKQIEMAGVRSLQAHFRMATGVMHIMRSDGHAVEANFTYDSANWKPPLVEFTNGAGQGALAVDQGPTQRPAMRQGRCEWEVRLPGHIPLDLSIKLGAGQTELRLGGLALTRLTVDNGLGALDLDLAGEWKNDLQAFVKTGIGDARLRLPREVGVRLQAGEGFGKIEPAGLTWDGETYVNAALRKSPVTFEIRLESGMGKVSILD